MQSVPITTNVESLNLAHGEVYSIQHYVIKFVSDLRQVDSFLHHDITEIFLNVALNTVTLTEGDNLVSVYYPILTICLP
jgi:hypothetical protein